MIMIFTALYCEAHPLIQVLGLKKDFEHPHFQVFRNEDVVLLVTGCGIVNAAMGVTYLCSAFSPGPSDLLVNIGVCGANMKDTPVGSVILCNKIHDAVSGHCFYPDMLFSHPFRENSIVSCTHIVDTKEVQAIPENLIDMEASGIYQGGSLFLHPHQMIFVKIVSDHLEGEPIHPKQVSELIQNNLSSVIPWMTRLQQQIPGKYSPFSPEEEHYLHYLAKSLRLSVTMTHQLKQIIHYYKLQNGNFLVRMKAFLGEKQLPVKTKKEGKDYFEQLKKEFI